ncbi:hypothetical protein H257_06757 [Aphanomyces astaci]|uniref:Vesicle transport protein n=1 Tax=Aphanomyces astaci TaxID=112090 RepID=W4GM94_APHAT|nr:hypothetical protein H257_06757 [Aphanomyces astaci]ETV80486.1 hypothetical protein H257_06757 [Aphanomyces astaci]RQM28359.1 hypothetical protein B5M09_006219 [Aphanomyces astaci]|eukprot:XP_009830410.1 hypothetical protein H257_06757 [Aphanomyces astaci]
MYESFKQQGKRLLDGNNEPASPTVALSDDQDYQASCPSLRLSYKERLLGCGICFFLGMMLSFGSTARLGQLVAGRPAPFAICYTLGNLLSVGCTMFFVGPVSQCQSMFHAKRRVAAAIYLGFIAITLTLCFSPSVPHRSGLVVLSVLVQFGALSWYTLSYIPYGQAAFLSVTKRFCCQPDVV